uniref:Reverse transcriptase domain-containing protein n=1 Tax=Tanacetum cinerariifolium TaxID=118510 RepID=A0A699GQ86_TANCI|nr:hypothetical protein [Tanacetum cinerariifolium]
MPSRRLKKKYVKRLAKKRVAKAIEEYEKTRGNMDNPGSSGGNSENAGGIVNVQGSTKIQRMEQELWTLTLKGDDIEAYNNHFHELALMCPEPTTLHEAINMSRELVEQAVHGKAARPGLCPLSCSKCHKLGHEEEDCQTRIRVARGNSLQNVTCFGCREKGYYRDKCTRGRNPHNEVARGIDYLMRTEEP